MPLRHQVTLTDLIQFTKSHPEIIPRATIPMDPFPDIKDFQVDWSKLTVGEVKQIPLCWITRHQFQICGDGAWIFELKLYMPLTVLLES